jgi:hypothetical protein
LRCDLRLENAAHDDPVLQHGVVVLVVADRRALEDQRRHRSLPQSSSASRFTAGAAGFFILASSDTEIQLNGG